MDKGLRWAALGALLVGCFALGYALYGRAQADASGNPLLSIVREALDDPPLVGRVEQQLRAGSYTYLAVRTGDGVKWAVTLGAGAAVGTRISLRSLGHHDHFYSRRLGRTFEALHFGIVTQLKEEMEHEKV